jgi:hypothetical protein
MMLGIKTGDESRKRAQRTYRHSTPVCGTMCRRGVLKTKPLDRVRAVGSPTDGGSSTAHERFVDKTR